MQVSVLTVVRLSRDNRWGNFWSVSGSWRFTGEKFMESIKNVLSDGKLRVSYGVNGTQPYGYYSYMNLYKYGEYYDGESGMGIVGVGNDNLKWEKNYAFDVGLDLTFLSRYTATFDFYTRTTKDLIYDMPISRRCSATMIMLLLMYQQSLRILVPFVIQVMS